MFYKKQELFALRGRLGSSRIFDRVTVAHRFRFLCAVFCFVCPRSVSCVPNVASFSGLSILDSRLSLTFIYLDRPFDCL